MNVGDPVTSVVLLGQENVQPSVSRGSVRDFYGRGFVALVEALDGALFVFDLQTEGMMWIRDHHTEDSEQGAALLAAYALTR